jgi:hypothetical protein
LWSRTKPGSPHALRLGQTGDRTRRGGNHGGSSKRFPAKLGDLIHEQDAAVPSSAALFMGAGEPPGSGPGHLVMMAAAALRALVGLDPAREVGRPMRCSLRRRADLQHLGSELMTTPEISEAESKLYDAHEKLLRDAVDLSIGRALRSRRLATG